MRYCKKQSVSSERTLHYLKTFESVDSENGLRDFCETYLAYLLDGDFELSVRFVAGRPSYKQKDFYQINLVKLVGNAGEDQAGLFTWNHVKDSYIPFIHMLNKQYDLIDDRESYRRAGSTGVPCISLYNASQNFCVSIKDVLSGKHLPGRYDYKPLLQITIRVEIRNKLVE